MSMRLSRTEQRYQNASKNGKLRPINQEKPIQLWVYWRIVANRFPHDKISTQNDMVVLNREATLDTIKSYEWRELKEIVEANKDNYDLLTMNLPSMSSVRNIPHFHLYKLKDRYK